MNGERMKRKWEVERTLLIKALKSCEERLCQAYEIDSPNEYNPLPSANNLSHCPEAGAARKLLRECGIKV